MNTSRVKPSLYNDLKKASSRVDNWPDWKRNSLKCSSGKSLSEGKSDQQKKCYSKSN